MARLPIEGSDSGSWGSILNDYLSQIHKPDGTLKDGIIGMGALGSDVTNAINSGSDPASIVQISGAQTITGVKTFSASPVVPTPGGSTDAANKSYVDTAVSSKATDSAVVHNTGAETIAGVKTFSSSPSVPTPTTGSDAANKTYVDAITGVDTTVFVHKTGAETIAGVKTFSNSPVVPTTTANTDVTNKVYVDTAVAGVSGGSTPDATTSVKGKIQLAGDLAGTAALPTVPGLTAKADDSATVHKTGAETIAGVKTFSSAPIVPTPTANTETANKVYVDTAVAGVSGGSTPDATTSVKGKLQLAGDLAGTAALPTVPGLAAKANDSAVVHNTGAETIAGVKTFSSPVVVAAPVGVSDATTKSYVDTAVASGGSSTTQSLYDVKMDNTTSYRGVNLAGAEFGLNNTKTILATTGFSWPLSGDYTFLATKGHKLIRLPFRWERIQPTLGGALDSTGIGNLQQAVTNATNAGLKVVLDLHNFASYFTDSTTSVKFGQGGLSTAANFQDIWVKLSTIFKNNPTVIGYGLMNEPESIPDSGGLTGNQIWQAYAQAAVTAIRANGDMTCICVGGYTASAIGSWFNQTAGQPVPWIVDPLNNIRYEAHAYWDTAGGSYPGSYSATNAAIGGTPATATDNIGKSRLPQLRGWLQWLRQNNLKGFLGEFGWPRISGSTAQIDSDAWNAFADRWLDIVDGYEADVWTAAWATGSAWSSTYNLKMYGTSSGSPGTALAVSYEQAATLEAHPTFAGRLVEDDATNLPSSYGSTVRGYNVEISTVTSNAAVVSGQYYVTLVTILEPGPLDKIQFYVGVAAAAPTAGQCFVGVYDTKTNALLAISDDISTNMTSVGYKNLDLNTITSRSLKIGETVYVAFLYNGTSTMPSLGKASMTSDIVKSMVKRFTISGVTTDTSLPNPLPSLTATANQSSNAFYFAVSAY